MPAAALAARSRRFDPPSRGLALEISTVSKADDPMLYLVPDGPAAEAGYGVLRTALARRQRWALGASPTNALQGPKL